MLNAPFIMKTAKQHNAPQTGEYDFRPNTNTVYMIGGDTKARCTMTSLFEACGWKVKFKRRSKNADPRCPLTGLFETCGWLGKNKKGKKGNARH